MPPIVYLPWRTTSDALPKTGRLKQRSGPRAPSGLCLSPTRSSPSGKPTLLHCKLPASHVQRTYSQSPTSARLTPYPSRRVIGRGDNNPRCRPGQCQPGSPYTEYLGSPGYNASTVGTQHLRSVDSLASVESRVPRDAWWVSQLVVEGVLAAASGLTG